MFEGFLRQGHCYPVKPGIFLQQIEKLDSVEALLVDHYTSEARYEIRTLMEQLNASTLTYKHKQAIREELVQAYHKILLGLPDRDYDNYTKHIRRAKKLLLRHG